MRRSWVLLLSSCSAWGDVCCTSSWVSFCASSCGACGFPQHVLPRVPFGGYLTFLAQDAFPAPAVELCLWGLRYLSCGACLALCRALLPPPVVCAASLPPVTLKGFCPFWPRLPALLLHWWRVLGCHPALVFSGVLLHRLPCRCSLDLRPVSGCSHCGCHCSCSDCVVVPCGSPSLRALLVVLSSPPGVLSLCGGLCYVHCLFLLALGWVCFWPAVSAAHVSCEVGAVAAALRGSSSCFLCLSFPCSSGPGCLVTVFWPLLLLLDGVLVGSLVRHSVALASWRPSPSVVLAWVSSFGVCSGLVGRLRSCLDSSLL